MARSTQESMDTFANVSIELGEALDTKITLVPECETEAEVTDWSMNVFPNTDDPGEFRAIFNLIWTVLDPQIIKDTELDQPRGRQTVFLDTEKGWDGKGPPPLARGRNKNVSLGRLLEGFGLNKKGSKFKWSSFMHERRYVRFQLPRNQEIANMSDVVAVGKDRNSVLKPGRKAAA